jgi:hypothetical protein
MRVRGSKVGEVDGSVDLASASAILPTVFVLAVLVGFSLWVLHDARVRQANREPVVVTVLGVTISEPAIWAALCLVLFIVACPLYLAARRSS